MGGRPWQRDKLPAQRSSQSEIDAFLTAAAHVPALAQTRGRLIFAIDATMSRQPSWDRAAEIQTDMFEVAQSIGGLAVQLVYFRGRGEFQASEWTTTPSALAARMRDVRCRSGFTQLRRVLEHAANEARRTRVGALVYVGDCFEELPRRRGEGRGGAGAARCARLHVPRGRRSDGRQCLQGGRAPDQGRLCALRFRRRAPAARSADGRGRLCDRRRCRACANMATRSAAMCCAWRAACGANDGAAGSRRPGPDCACCFSASFSPAPIPRRWPRRCARPARCCWVLRRWRCSRFDRDRRRHAPRQHGLGALHRRPYLARRLALWLRR